MMRYGRLKGTMEQCLREIQESQLPGEFLLTQVRSLVRYLREVDGLCGHIKKESGWESDTTAYLEILCAKEDSTLFRRVSDTRILKQDFDDKRREWRRAKKNVINSISEMCARALKFECSERKTVALHAIQYYKNVMAKDDGAIPGESESTDGLIDQYRRHRDEISKIPMYADSIMKMLKDIRRTVNATSKLPGSSAFTQFLEEWWASVVRFLEHSSIVDAEKNAREVMQTLKKLKGKQEDNRKREMLRLMSKLDATDKEAPIPSMTPTSGPVEIVDDSINPENTVRCKEWKDSEEPSNGRELCTVSQGDDQEDDQGDDSIADEGDTEHEYDANEGHDDIDHDIDDDNGNAEDDEEDDDNDERMDEVSELASGHGDAIGSAWSEADATPRNRRGSRGFTSMSSMSGPHRDRGSVGSWDAASEPTLGTDAGTDRDVAAASGLPEGEGDDGDDGEEDFEAADSLDLGAVALCTVGTGADGHQTYQDATCTPQAMRHINERVGVEQERFSAALDFFRQEQREKGKRPAAAPLFGSSRYQLGGGRGRGASRRGRGRSVLSGGRGHRDTLKQANGVLNGSSYRENASYVSNTAAISSSSRYVQGQGSSSARKRATVVLSASSQTSSKMPATGIRRDS